jgi:hypothetical protein
MPPVAEDEEEVVAGVASLRNPIQPVMNFFKIKDESEAKAYKHFLWQIKTAAVAAIAAIEEAVINHQWVPNMRSYNMDVLGCLGSLGLSGRIDTHVCVLLLCRLIDLDTSRYGMQEGQFWWGSHSRRFLGAALHALFSVTATKLLKLLVTVWLPQFST